MKATNLLIIIVIFLNLIIIYRLFTFDTTKISITETVKKISKKDKEFELSTKEITALEEIVLKENGTPEDVKKYIDDIYKISLKKKAYSDRIPEIDKLCKIDSKYIPLMLNSTHAKDSHRFFHAMLTAIKRNIKDSQKQLVIDKLSSTPELIQIVIDKGWLNDAKEILYSSIKSRERYYNTEWINAVSQVADKTIYPYLIHYLVHGMNRFWTFEYIKDLPSIDLKESVQYLWKNRNKLNHHSEYDELEIAKIATIYGHKDALTILIRKLNAPKEERWGVEEILNNYVDVPVNEYDIMKWFEDNKGKITYDELTQKWTTE